MAINFVTDQRSENASASDQFPRNCVHSGLWNDYGWNHHHDHPISGYFFPDAEKFCQQYDGICQVGSERGMCMERSQIKQHLADPEFFAENRLRPVSDHMWYETEKEALKKEKIASSDEFGRSMEIFCYAPNPDSVPDGFERKDYSCDGWNTISVPAHMELQGYGRPIIRIRTIRGTGSRRSRLTASRRSTIQQDAMYGIFLSRSRCKKKKLLLTFEGVETAFHCWINGHYVGYWGG